LRFTFLVLLEFVVESWLCVEALSPAFGRPSPDFGRGDTERSDVGVRASLARFPSSIPQILSEPVTFYVLRFSIVTTYPWNDDSWENNMDIEQLRAFERIVREGSFSRAAQGLDIAQPTISARIRMLEQAVGGALFVRRGRRLALTEVGESFLPYAHRVLSVLDEGIEAARLSQEGQRGRLTLGVIESLTGGFLASAVAHFHATHPQVELFLRSGHSDEIVEMLEDGVVKLGLIAWPIFGIDLVPLLRFQEPLILVVPSGHPLSQRPSVSIEEAATTGAPLLRVRWGPSVRTLMAKLGALTEVMVEVPIDTARQMLLRGTGAAFLTRTLVADDLAAGRVVQVPVENLPPLFRESALVHLQGRALPSATKDFVMALEEESRRLFMVPARG
nr:LysR family transcriptional regulator [Ardenticatenales bacterium]